MAPRKKKVNKSPRTPRVPNNRLVNRAIEPIDQAKVTADVVVTGFKDIDRTPGIPKLEPGHLMNWKRPNFPTDKTSRDQLINIFEEKLKLVRNAAIEEINANDTETEDDLLQRIPTAQNPLARLLADPEKPMPIAFQAQDLVRLYLYEVDTVRDLEKDNTVAKESAQWKGLWNAAVLQRDIRWNALVNILQRQLPGEEDDRREQVARVLQDILQEQLEMTDD